MQVETLLIRNIAHTGYKCGQNIEVDSQRVLELLHRLKDRARRAAQTTSERYIYIYIYYMYI